MPASFVAPVPSGPAGGPRPVALPPSRVRACAPRPWRIRPGSGSARPWGRAPRAGCRWDCRQRSWCAYPRPGTPNWCLWRKWTPVHG
ncbi:hypothetical protein DA2_3875 [Desulfovibrio sp. A2]|nr:hypothetical protein DA2_3875 [Desulfovibrio sp. A2]